MERLIYEPTLQSGIEGGGNIRGGLEKFSSLIVRGWQ